jgi:hypothetical protein
VIFHPYQKKINYEVDLKIFDNDSNSFISLERKQYVKYLGLLIDRNLTWKYHISHVASKISKTVGIISKLRHFVPRNTLINIYKSLILPHISYGIAVWDQAAKVHLDKILKLQKRVLRLIYTLGIINPMQFLSFRLPIFYLLRCYTLNMFLF